MNRLLRNLVNSDTCNAHPYCLRHRIYMIFCYNCRMTTTTGNIYADRVETVRQMMAERGWDAVIITGSDPHGSEYPAPRWQQVEWVSGFTGEAGDIVITASHAGLWTDTRYFIQAERQLAGTGIVLHKTRVPEQVLIPEWLAGEAFPTSDKVIIAVDGLCQSVSAVEDIMSAFSGRECRIASVPDMLDGLWTDRPAVPQTPITELEDEQAGESSESKIEWLREFLRNSGCDAMLVTALDEIAWLFNVRGSDIEYNPLVISYMIVSMDEVRWFVHDCYDDIAISLSETEGRIFADPATLNWHLYSIMDKDRLVLGDSPVQLRKAVKNPVEIEGERLAHLRDGIAVEKFLFWLETELPYGVSEWDAAQKLASYRAEIPGYQGDSFETISAYGKGAALPHYVTPRMDAPMIEEHGLYLCDSGGQYSYGTTDITRTVPTGPCTELEREDYTLVLKGHIDLAMAVFPKGTAGCQIDALAREPLWSRMRNFGHGTGHGVGFYLGVHEGPQDIRQNFNRQPLLPGMVTSDEPGLYREGMHGIRHENLLLCKELCTNEFGTWLGFEPLTLCHFDTEPIIRGLLNEDEIKWLNEYNARVFRELSPYLSIEMTAWLKEKTEAI